MSSIMQFLSLCLCHALYIHCTFMISDLYLVCQIWWINPTVHVHFQITTCLTPLLILAPLTEQCDMGNKQPSVWCWDQTQACLCAVNQCSAIHQSGWGAQREPSAVNNPPPPPLPPVSNVHKYIPLQSPAVPTCPGAKGKLKIEKQECAHVRVCSLTQMHTDSLCKCHKRLQWKKRHRMLKITHEFK